MALAGTAAPGDERAFEHDPKELEEHALVVEALQRRLAEFGEVRTGERVVLDLGGMSHFLTPIDVALARDVDEGEIVRTLHPTPAIGVQPRDAETLDWLSGLRDAQGTPSVFGAPFGVKWEGGVHMVVAIRCVIWEKDRLALPSGCGVVGASDRVAEWRELALKRGVGERGVGARVSARLASEVLAALAGEGVGEFCVCAGARNLAFVVGLERSQGARVWHFFDERAAGFFALGRMMNTGCPVAVVTTSGTAVAELLPATIEAHYQSLPLVLLTADRPARFRGSGAPQAIEQPGMLAPYARLRDIEEVADGLSEVRRESDRARAPGSQ